MDILLKKEIELIEEITGKKFGPMPLVLPNNAQNRLLAYFLDQATTGDRFEALNAAKEYSKTEADGNGKYFPSAHIVLFPETGRGTESIRWHELVHAYVCNRSDTLLTTTQQFIEYDMEKEGLPEKSSIETLYIDHALNEGIATYVARQAINRVREISGSVERFDQPLPPPETAKSCFSMETYLAEIEITRFMENISKDNSTLQYELEGLFVHGLAGSIGRKYVIIAAHHQTENGKTLGAAIDEIIYNPPRTLKRLEEKFMVYAEACPPEPDPPQQEAEPTILEIFLDERPISYLDRMQLELMFEEGQ